jgi:hypothetical protein
MKRLTNELTLGIALTLLGTGSLCAQSQNPSLRQAADLTDTSAPGMADFLRSEAAKMHCCATEQFLEGAILYKRAAEHGLSGSNEISESAVDDLRLAGYLFFYAGAFDRAFNALARVGVIERERGNQDAAAGAFLEAAHVARRSGDLQRAREILLASQELDPEPLDVAEKP